MNEVNNLSDDATALWNRVKQIFLLTLQSEDEKQQVERHFEMVTRITKDGNTCKVHVANEFAAEIFRNRYQDKIKGCLTLAGESSATNLVFKVDEQQPAKIIAPVNPQVYQTPPTETKADFISTIPLNKDYTFEEFVEGNSNSFACAAAKGVVKSPGIGGHNPLFIYGSSGLGKTHLMQAIGNELKNQNPNIAICYITSESFLNEYVNSLAAGAGAAFRLKYRNIDVLLIDDIQFFRGKGNIQEEFFNTFNDLQIKQKQIVMTSDVSPSKLPNIDSRLITRFESGMVQEIESPSDETRLAILKKKAEGTKIPLIALKFIADNIKSNVRSMEGALSKVKFFIDINPQEELNLPILNKLLKDVLEKEQRIKKLTVEEIQNSVAKKFGITLGQILSSERTASLVTPRQLAMYISRHYTTKSLTEIAALFDKKHATVLWGVKQIKKRLDVEEDLKLTLAEILSEFNITVNDAAEEK